MSVLLLFDIKSLYQYKLSVIYCIPLQLILLKLPIFLFYFIILSKMPL